MRQLGVRLVREKAPANLMIMGDRFRLEQVIVNLMQNAMEALEDTPTPVVTLSILHRGAEIDLIVADNGPGVPAESATSCSRPLSPASRTGSAWAWSSAVTSSPVSAANCPCVRRPRALSSSSP